MCPYRYEFDYGPVHFFLMSTEHDFTVGSPQYNYMKARLSMVDRSKTPWVVFAGHRWGSHCIYSTHTVTVPMHSGRCTLTVLIILLRLETYQCLCYSGTLWSHSWRWAHSNLITSVMSAPQENKVDLALWGHHHSYQRTCPVFNTVCTEGATTHVVIGMGGQGLSKNIQ